MLNRTILLISLFFPFHISLADTTISVAGSSTVLPIMADAAEIYKSLNSAANITVSGGGSGTGINSVINGINDIGMTSRHPTAAEQEKLTENFDIIDIARDAVAITVSAEVIESGVDVLSLKQVADIYRGKIKNWKEVGGFDKKILVIDKEPSRGTRHVFAEVVLGNAKARAPGASVVSGSNNEERSIISRSKQAIGMLSYAWLNDNARGMPLQLENGDTVTAEPKNVLNGRYPIQRSLSIIVAKKRSNELQSFIEFLQSESITSVIEKNGYLPLAASPARATLN
ncbi:MAG: PstS family phosphate ABC transporter substrate-binding protein [Gammaproteobacteria bacterium]|nr:PstS family phosphate ABC transporter substrate-binding protein [Gammaproteobacteria bacterium]